MSLFVPENKEPALILPSYVKLDMAFGVGAGSTLFDKSRYRSHGTITGASWAAGLHGYALDFNGSTGFVDCGVIDYSTFKELTLEALFYRDTSSARAFLIRAGYPPFQLQISIGNIPHCEIEIDNVYYNLTCSGSPPPLLSGSWWHLIFTHILSSGVSAFVINGVNYSGTTKAGTAYTGAVKTTIGLQFDGKIGVARILRKALTASESLARYNAIV